MFYERKKEKNRKQIVNKNDNILDICDGHSTYRKYVHISDGVGGVRYSSDTV